MCIKSLFFSVILFSSFVNISAQQELECKTKLSLFHQAAREGNFDVAYEPWLYVKDNCPDLNLAIYADGEKILKHKIDNSQSDSKIEFITMLVELWKTRSQYFKSNTPQGEYDSKSCQLLYDYKDELGKNNEELFNCFDKAFVGDKETFTHPKSLYAYFSLMVEMFDDNKKSATELFNVYDNISEKIQEEIQNYSEKLNVLLAKVENGGTLTTNEENKKIAYESYLKNYSLIQNNIDVIIDKKANCENLIPLYLKSFEEHKNDSIWLKRAVSRMYHKECTEDAFYEKIVKQYDAVVPSADSKVYVATVLLKKGKDDEAYSYLKQGYELENQPYKKANLAFKIGVILKNKGQYAKARGYFLEALKLNPSNGKPHLLIAQMYGDSAKSCGKDNFHQRAVYWLAANEAKRVTNADPSLQKIVNQKVKYFESIAPTREEIFTSGLTGKTIQVGCWINRPVKVPELD